MVPQGTGAAKFSRGGRAGPTPFPGPIREVATDKSNRVCDLTFNISFLNEASLNQKVNMQFSLCRRLIQCHRQRLDCLVGLLALQLIPELTQ
jgi:hypothetical protein